MTITEKVGSFVSKGQKYEILHNQVIKQANRQPFKYDENYASCYDKPEYKAQSDLLQAMRYVFATTAHGGPIHSLCDFGFGNGAFLSFVKDKIMLTHGYDVTTVPPPDGCVKVDAFDLFSEPFDCITFWDSLEHCPEIGFVRGLQCETICISLPYCHWFEKGTDWFETWHHHKPNEHLYYFNESSLRLFMEEAGWRQVALSQFEDIVRKRGTDWNILSMAFKRK